MIILSIPVLEDVMDRLVSAGGDERALYKSGFTACVLQNTTSQKRIAQLPNLLIYMLTLVFAAGLERILEDLHHHHRGLSPSFLRMFLSISARM